MATTSVLQGFILILTLIVSVRASKLNVPRVLLPIFNDFSTSFLLEANDGGCYKWITTRNDVIKLTPIAENLDFHCSMTALVSTVTKEPVRNLAVVLAEDVHTDQVLKCDVVVDVITNLSITTTTRELFMEEVPESFEVKAYDDQGNEFSTLAGIEFEWNIVSLGPKTDSTVVRYLRFKDSPYESPEHIEVLEDEDKKGSIILLEGVKTGTTRVSVRLPQQEYKNVPPIEVTLSVIANLLLTPGEVYLMPGDEISFKLFFIRSGRLEQVVLPDTQYYLESEDSSVILVDKKSSKVSATKKEGTSRVFLRSSNVKSNETPLKLPSAVVHVAQAAYIVLTILPNRNWAILIGDEHEITAELYTSTDHKMHVGPGVEIQTTVAESFHIEERSRNGSWLVGWGLKESRVVVQASLESITHPKIGKIKLENPLLAHAELYIYPRITITPSEVILPWDPQVKPRYDIELVAKGGDGRFLWSTSDYSVGVVLQSGVVKTLTKGVFDVSAVMTRNHHNRQIAKFAILPPVRLEIVEFVMEAEVNQPIHIHLAMYALKMDIDNATESYIPFTHCQDLPFQVKQSDNKFVYNKTASLPSVGISCGNIAMIGTAVGTTKVTISYYQDGNLLEDSVTISAYNPLKLVSPKPHLKFVLAVGSSGHLLFRGGPRPQIGRQTDHQRIIFVENEAIAQSQDVTNFNSLPAEDNSAVYVLCRKLGETILKLTISNTPSLPNCKTMGSVIVVKIICGKPRKVFIQPQIKVPDTKSCPMDVSADRIVVPNKQTISLDVIVLDELGRPFLNASSLLFHWETKPAGQAQFGDSEGVMDKIEMIGTVPLLNKTEQTVRPYFDSGLIEVTGTVTGYKMSVLNAYHITPEWPEFLSGSERDMEIPKITGSIGLFLVDDTVVSPNTTIVFNQVNVKKEITVVHGSGYVELALSNNDVATVNYIEGTRVIEIVPINSGELTIQIVDLCLVANPVFIYAKVVSLGRIDIATAGKVEINHCIEVVIRLYDETDTLLNLEDAAKVDLKHRFSKNIANLWRMPYNTDEPWPLGEIHYVLTGVELGDAQLLFTFANRDDVIQSLPVDIQVFSPLRVNPRNGTLLIGSTLQLTLKGGPQPDFNVEFIPGPNSTISINDVGIVSGEELGSTLITVQSVGVHPISGDKIVYAEDVVEVVVIEMTGIKIAAPLTKFRSGSTIPVWVVGIPDSISPLILASFEEGFLSYIWTLKDLDYATKTDIFTTVGVVYKPNDASIIRVTGIQPGRTRLTVDVTRTFPGANPRPAVTYSASIEIEIIEAMSLLQPVKLPGRSLLMARHSSLQLRTNLDPGCQIEYKIPDHRLVGTEVTSTDSTPVAMVTVTETGYLQAYSTNGYAELLITATDEFGLKQTLSYVVEVKPVTYMMLQVSANWRIHLDSSLQVLPLGTEFEIIASFFDNIGNKFVAGPKDVKVRANRLDLVKLKMVPSNATVVASLRGEGHTVIKAWTEGLDNTADYIMIHAKEVVKPVVNFLTSGDIICLWSPVVTRHLQIGAWTTNDDSKLTIDSSIDVGFVVGNKEGTILLTHSLSAYVPVQFQVLPVAEILLFPEKLAYITNGVEGSVQRVPLVIRSKMGPADKWNNLIQGWLCDRSFYRYVVPTPFRCFLAFTNESILNDPREVFSFKSSFNPELGQYNCKILSTGSNSSEISTLETNVTIWVVSDESDIESKPVVLPFIPNVYVPFEIHIGDDGTNVGEIIIKGLTHILDQIQVTAADSSIIYVDRGAFIDGTSKRFEVHLVDFHPKFADVPETMGIIVTSPITEQKSMSIVRVSRRYRDDACAGKSPIYRFIQYYKHSIIIFFSMLIIFFVSCFVYSNYMQPQMTMPTQHRACLPQSPFGPPIAGSTPLGPMNSPIRQPHVCINKMNCSCGASFAMMSPEMRRNRRFL